MCEFCDNQEKNLSLTKIWDLSKKCLQMETKQVLIVLFILKMMNCILIVLVMNIHIAK